MKPVPAVPSRSDSVRVLRPSLIFIHFFRCARQVCISTSGSVCPLVCPFIRPYFCSSICPLCFLKNRSFCHFSAAAILRIKLKTLCNDSRPFYLSERPSTCPSIHLACLVPKSIHCCSVGLVISSIRSPNHGCHDTLIIPQLVHSHSWNLANHSHPFIPAIAVPPPHHRFFSNSLPLIPLPLQLTVNTCSTIIAKRSNRLSNLNGNE